MRFLLTLILIGATLSVSAQTPLDVIDTFAPGAKREYGVDGINLRVCAKIANASTEILEQQCGSKFGDCINITNVQFLSESVSWNRKRISADYITVPEGNLKFQVINNTDHPHEIQVTAYNPDYRINELYEFLSKQTRIFSFESETPLYVYAGIALEHQASLINRCNRKFGCIKVEDFRVDKWVSQSSGLGLGQKLSPDKNGLVRLKVTNDYTVPAMITIYARIPDVGACI